MTTRRSFLKVITGITALGTAGLATAFEQVGLDQLAKSTRRSLTREPLHYVGKPVKPCMGDMVFDFASNQVKVYNGTEWLDC